MEEVNFIDQVRLVAIDHPEGTDVFPNERFLSETPFAKAKTILSQTSHAPAGAWDDHGDDVLPLLRTVDHTYVKDFTNLPYAGFTDSHALTLDLGAWTPERPLLLLLHGFIEYFSANSMYAAWQAGIAPVAALCRSSTPEWFLAAHHRRHGLPCRFTAHDSGRPHRESTCRESPHTYGYEPADLLGSGACR